MANALTVKPAMLCPREQRPAVKLSKVCTRSRLFQYVVARVQQMRERSPAVDQYKRKSRRSEDVCDYFFGSFTANCPLRCDALISSAAFGFPRARSAQRQRRMRWFGALITSLPV